MIARPGYIPGTEPPPLSIETESRTAHAPGSRLVRAAAVGLVAGFLSGLFGVGGGIVIVPALS